MLLEKRAQVGRDAVMRYQQPVILIERNQVPVEKPVHRRGRGDPVPELATATCGTIRLKHLKIGALVTRSARRIRVAMPSSCPDAAFFRIGCARLRSWSATPMPVFNATNQPQHPSRRGAARSRARSLRRSRAAA
jgi:Transposase DDE domain group 1